MVGYIYMTTNNINGKIYIGQSTQITNNGRKYYYGSGTILLNSIKKYGKENFTKEIIKDNIHCQTALDLYEIIYIKKYNSLSPNGYNLSLGGNGKGKVSEETKKKISDSEKGTKKKPLSIEHKKFISDHFSGINNPFYGKKHTEETRKIIKEKRKLQTFSEETRKKLSEAQIKRWEKIKNKEKEDANKNQ